MRMVKDNTIEVLSKDMCCGCGACYNACPAGAIQMKEDEEGFIYPEINEEQCILCGLCQKKCPELNEKRNNSDNPECMSVWAEDNIRLKSSSGGMFSLLAENILENDGYVCGVEMTDDFEVRHTIIHNKENLDKLRKSKYVQSYTGTIYLQTKKLLDNGKKVLFTGCPCQVAALYTYLGKDYQNLVTADIMCHGVPSQKIFRQYLEENFNTQDISKFEFRTKKKGYTCVVSEITNKDGSKVFKTIDNDLFEKGFHSSMILRPSCENCKFAEIPRGGDFTIGDFWGISQFDKKLNDQKGTSLVLINNDKAKRLFEEIRPLMKSCVEVPFDIARRNNRFGRKIKISPLRKRFLEMAGYTTLEKALEYTSKGKYDVGVIGLWYGRNYGSMITYYALNKILKNMGLSVLMINNPLAPDGEIEMTKTSPRLFAEQYYEVSRKFRMNELAMLNNICDTFIVGSDQLWNYVLSKPYGQMYFLDFVQDKKKKIAYGTSFGKEIYTGTEEYRKLSKRNMERFDYVSVREDYAVQMCSDLYGVKSEKVLDPVFLCEPSEYDALIKDSGLKKDEDYILAYILDPSNKKTEVLRYLGKVHKKKIKVILDEPPYSFENNVKRMELLPEDNIEILKEVDIKEWLYYFKYSDAVLTDSFHGSCFSIIFKKPFLSIINHGRGGKRFQSLLKNFDLEKYMVNSPENIIENQMKFEFISYENTFKKIEEERTFSLQWLRKALFSSKTVKNYKVYTVHEESSKNEKEALFYEILKEQQNQNKKIEQMTKQLTALEKEMNRYYDNAVKSLKDSKINKILGIIPK